MRDLGVLFFIVLLVYLFQCLCWAPARAVVFSMPAEGNRGRRKTGFVWSALNITGYWCNPFPFLDPVAAVYWPAFQPEPEVLLLPMDQRGSTTALWENLRITRVGTKLLCDDLVVFQGGPDQLTFYQDFLQKLKLAKVRQRKKIIGKWLRYATDAAAARSRVELFQEKTLWLAFAVNLEFFLLFIMVPVAFLRFGSSALWPSVAALLLMALLTVWQFWKAHKNFFPADADTRWKAMFSILGSPVYAIRAMDPLAKDVLAEFHPATVASVVCRQTEFEAFAGEQLRMNRYGAHGESWYSQQFHLALAQMLEKSGVNTRHILAAPKREEGCVLYCPRCRAQYTKVRQHCADCDFEHLVEFQGTSVLASQPM